MQQSTLFWFRRDLRLKDNHGLFNALKSGRPVVCLFIFDTNILSRLEKKDPRVEFIHNSIVELKNELEEHGSTLDIRIGDPEKIFPHLIRIYNIRQVIANHDYDAYSISRDSKIKELLEDHNIKFNTFKDSVIFEKKEIFTIQGNPYTVFTPYSKKWKESIKFNKVTQYKSELLLNNLEKCEPRSIPSINDLGFEKTNIDIPIKKLSIEMLKNYDRTRDFPSLKNGTSKLGVHLRFGTVSIRECVNFALSFNNTWLNELIWRDFYIQILYNFPHSATQSFKKDYDKIKWENNLELFQKWCEGKTGFPLIDAGMRELNSTGFMHNRVRMLVASFLCKNLRIDWRWGERYFAKKLLDYELASNVGNWQWAAGSGVDAAPYFRIFNPTLQIEKFDNQHLYIKKWIPELKTPDYPSPIVNFIDSRDLCFKMYKKALIG